MTILSAQSIRARCMPPRMIQPFHPRTVDPETGMSYGLSSAGYDVRIAQAVTLRPGECALASIVERIEMPLDLLAMVADKSTWARRYLTVQHTVIEPGWRGFLTVELINHSALIIDIPRSAPIAQIVFHRLDEPTDQPYSGKYQDQEARPIEARREAVRAFDAYGDRPAMAQDLVIQEGMPDGNYRWIPLGGIDPPQRIRADRVQTREASPADDPEWPDDHYAAVPSQFRILHAISPEPDEPSVTIYIENRQIGYVLNDRLYLIGADNRASEICDVSDEGLLPGLLAQHYRAI